MRLILESCIDLDQRACETYHKLAESCADPEISGLFHSMAIEESMHVKWWTDLLKAWEEGLVPDIADEHGLMIKLEEIRAELLEIDADNLSCASLDDMLNIAVRFEFFMLDPMFGDLIELMQPGGKPELREAYSRHVLRLVEAVERHYSKRELASFLAGVLKRAYRDQQRLSTLAMHDQLTGLYNRRGVLSQLEQWLSWSRRYNRPLAVILADIDHFKRINDAHGHETGDRALMHVADALRETVRSADVIGRFGGDEFVIVAPEADGTTIEQLLERIVDAVEGSAITTGAQSLRITVSAGAAWVPGDAEITVESLIAMADRSMYAAKSAGRNQHGVPLVVISEPV